MTSIPDGGTLGLHLEGASRFTLQLRTDAAVAATLEIASTADGRLKILIRQADERIFDLTLTKGPSGVD